PPGAARHLLRAAAAGTRGRAEHAGADRRGRRARRHVADGRLSRRHPGGVHRRVAHVRARGAALTTGACRERRADATRAPWLSKLRTRGAARAPPPIWATIAAR